MMKFMGHGANLNAIASKAYILLIKSDLNKKYIFFHFENVCIRDETNRDFSVSRLRLGANLSVNRMQERL